MTRTEMVAEFRRAAGHAVHEEAELRRPRLHLRFIQSEVDELKDAIEAGDIVGFADALADIAYFVEGAALHCGIDLDGCFAEVHRSNMSKAPFLMDANGKTVKGPNYEPPKLSWILRPKSKPPRYNGGSEPCDMDSGPCCCGGWHETGDDE